MGQKRSAAITERQFRPIFRRNALYQVRHRAWQTGGKGGTRTLDPGIMRTRPDKKIAQIQTLSLPPPGDMSVCSPLKYLDLRGASANFPSNCCHSRNSGSYRLTPLLTARGNRGNNAATVTYKGDPEETSLPRYSGQPPPGRGHLDPWGKSRLASDVTIDVTCAFLLCASNGPWSK